MTRSRAAGAKDETTAELDASEIARGWQALAELRLQPTADISWGGRSDTGRARENNDDKFDFFLPDDPSTLRIKGRLWAVADGMGGHNAGQIASEAALKTIVRTYYSRPGDDVAEGLRAALTEANALIHQAAQQFPDRGGMGTTATVAVVRGDVLTIGQVGDSRAYLLREGQFRQITIDHSWVEEQVRRGGLTREQAEASPYRNVITRSIGMGDGMEPEIFTETLQTGDLVLLCSDGLSGFLEASEIQRHLQRPSPSEAALALIDAANDAGGRDNITAVVLAVRAAQAPGGSEEAAAAAQQEEK